MADTASFPFPSVPRLVLKAQYLFIFAGGLLAVFVVFVILYMAGVDQWVCIAFGVAAASVLVWLTFRLNSGQMMQSAALLYQLTGNGQYLKDAQAIAAACHNYFFMEFTPGQGEPFHMLKKGDVWFTAVMLRGFMELYQVDGNKVYLDSFARSLDYAWTHAREENGLFNTDFTGKSRDNRKWLLTQAAMVEMYARLAVFANQSL